jgi:hypothetical protein
MCYCAQGFLSNFAMDENELVFENVGGIDEIAPNMSTIPIHNLS